MQGIETQHYSLPNPRRFPIHLDKASNRHRSSSGTRWGLVGLAAHFHVRQQDVVVQLRCHILNCLIRGHSLVRDTG